MVEMGPLDSLEEIAGQTSVSSGGQGLHGLYERTRAQLLHGLDALGEFLQTEKGKVTVCAFVGGGSSFFSQVILNHALVNWFDASYLVFMTPFVGKGVMGTLGFSLAYLYQHASDFRDDYRSVATSLLKNLTFVWIMDSASAMLQSPAAQLFIDGLKCEPKLTTAVLEISGFCAKTYALAQLSERGISKQDVVCYVGTYAARCRDKASAIFHYIIENIRPEDPYDFYE